MGTFLVVALLPILTALVVTYPFYAVLRFLLTRRGLEPRRVQALANGYVWAVGAASIPGYVLGVCWLNDVDVLPRVRGWVEAGWLGLLVPVSVLDVILARTLGK